MSGMQSIVLLAAAVFFLAEARVTFLYSDVLQRNDMMVNGDNPFNCEDGCTVYLDKNTDTLFIYDDENEVANFTDVVGEPSDPLKGIDLPAGANYKLYRKDNTHEDFVFYAVSVNAPNYDTPVFAARPDEGVVASVEGQYATFLSSAMALNVFDFRGDFPGSGDVQVYSTGFDAVGDDVYGTTVCSPVYTSRSQANAEGAMLTVVAPIVTVHFAVNGNYSVSANTTAQGYDLPHKNATATVYMSSGYVGCPFVENNYFTMDPFDQDLFLQAANSVDISASYAHVNTRDPIFFRVNDDFHHFFNTDDNLKTFSKHYDKGVYNIAISWRAEEEAPGFEPAWRMQIDFTYGTDGYSTSPPTTTQKTEPTTSSSTVLHPLIAFIVMLLFVTY